MSSVIQSDRFRTGPGSSADSGGNNGGTVDDILKRLGAVESSVSDLRTHVGSMAAVMPHLATKADVSSLEASIIKWFVGTVIASAALTFGIVKLVVHSS